MTAEPTRMTKRKCRWCGETYRAPKGEKWKGCKKCAPTLYDAEREALGGLHTYPGRGIGPC